MDKTKTKFLIDQIQQLAEVLAAELNVTSEEVYMDISIDKVPPRQIEALEAEGVNLKIIVPEERSGIIESENITLRINSRKSKLHEIITSGSMAEAKIKININNQDFL
jgi:hypothetical protein